MGRTVVQYKKEWNFALRMEKHGSTLKLLIYNGKKSGNIQNKKFINKYIA